MVPLSPRDALATEQGPEVGNMTSQYVARLVGARREDVPSSYGDRRHQDWSASTWLKSNSQIRLTMKSPCVQERNERGQHDAEARSSTMKTYRRARASAEYPNKIMISTKSFDQAGHKSTHGPPLIPIKQEASPISSPRARDEMEASSD